jgi:hypothetical protein
VSTLTGQDHFLQFAEFRFATQLWQTNKKPLNEGVSNTRIVMRILLVLLFLLSFNSLASEASRTYFEESISFESYLNENTRLKANYQCDFNKAQNRYFEFIFAVLTIETKDENEIINSQIIAKPAIDKIKRLGASRLTNEHSFSEIICVTEKSAYVFQTEVIRQINHPMGTGYSWVTKYTFTEQNGDIKLMPYFREDNKSFYGLGNVTEASSFKKVEFNYVVTE